MFTSQDSYLESQGGVGMGNRPAIGLARLPNRSSICTMPGPKGGKFFQPEWGGEGFGNRKTIFGRLIYVVLVLSLPVRVTALKIICRVRGLS